MHRTDQLRHRPPGFHSTAFFPFGTFELIIANILAGADAHGARYSSAISPPEEIGDPVRQFSRASRWQVFWRPTNGQDMRHVQTLWRKRLG